MPRTEIITRGGCPPEAELAPGVEWRAFASGAKGSKALATGTATLCPGATLGYHTHPSSEVIIPLLGAVEVVVEGRRYGVVPFDAIHVPAGVAHAVANPSGDAPATLLCAFASDHPTRDFVRVEFRDRDRHKPEPSDPESLVRFDEAPVYELAAGTHFRDLFAGRFGSKGLCGGHGRFEAGASLPCHVHGFDESITIVAGRAICQVAGKAYELADFDTACVPTGRPHRFLNRADTPMAMIWIYAGDEPDRTLVDPGYCEGVLAFEGIDR